MFHKFTIDWATNCDNDDYGDNDDDDGDGDGVGDGVGNGDSGGDDGNGDDVGNGDDGGGCDDHGDGGDGDGHLVMVVVCDGGSTAVKRLEQFFVLFREISFTN